MRSSIFSSDPPLLSSKKAKGSKKSKVSSPYISSPITPQLSTKFSNSGSNTPLFDVNISSSGNAVPKNLSWNIEELLATYNDTGSLPPPLSPTLPDSIPFEEKNPSSKQERSLASPKPKHVLKKSSIIDGGDDEDLGVSRIDSQSKPYAKEKDKRQDDDIPLSILSPTLPSIFDHNSNGTDTPESVVTSAGTSMDSTRTKTAKRVLVRSINRTNDPSKPRFLVRLSFTNKEIYQESISKRRKLQGPTGLGIFTVDIEGMNNETNPVPIEPMNPEPGVTAVSNAKVDYRLKELLAKEKLVQEKEKQIEKQEQELLSMEKSLKEKIKKQKELNEKELLEKEIKLKEYEKLLKSKEKAIDEREQKQKQRSPPLSSLKDDVSKKREQLKQLNNEVMIKEPSQPLEEIKIATQEDQRPVHLPKAMREEIKDSFQSKKNMLLQLSKTAKLDFESSVNKDDLRAIFAQVDYIILKIMASDFDERSKLVMDVLPSERSWKSLDQEVSDLITFIGNWNRSIKDNMISGFLRILASILFQTKALITKRINSILTKVIDSYLSKRADQKELSDKIIELQQTTIVNNNLISVNLMNSRPDFLFSSIPGKFPVTWSKRNISLETVQKDFNLYDFHKQLRPASQLFYLPFGVYSNLNEGSGFLFNITNEFIDIYNKHNPNNRVMYVLLSGKPL